MKKNELENNLHSSQENKNECSATTYDKNVNYCRDILQPGYMSEILGVLTWA